MDSESVNFIRMEDGTYEEYQFLDGIYQKLNHELADTVLGNLKKLEGDKMGYKIDRYQHSLQSATRAEADGADPEMVAAALVHDIGDELAPYNHAEIASGLLRPYVRAEVTWVVEQHGIFQMYYYAHHLGGNRNARDRFKGHEWYDACHRFCESWDQASFDPEYATKPLGYWEPLVRQIFGRKAHDPRYVKAEAA